MKIDFTNRRIFVTGSTRGIGFTAAEAFVAAGAQVVINNLGIFEPRDFFETSNADRERFFRSNLMSGVQPQRQRDAAVRTATLGVGTLIFAAPWRRFCRSSDAIS